jgi:hypothetical protein
MEGPDADVEPAELDRLMIERGWKFFASPAGKLVYIRFGRRLRRHTISINLNAKGKVSHDDFRTLLDHLEHPES